MLGGVNKPSLRRLASFSRHSRRSNRASPQASSALRLWEAMGGGTKGKGWVGAERSPGTSVCGTGRSRTGNRGAPVSRSSTKTKPVLVAWATAGTGRAPRSRVTRVGMEGRS